MKIAIPVIDKYSQRNRIAGSLNVIGCLCIYDTDSSEGRWMKTLELAPNMGELLPALERENVSAVISCQLHPMALKVLVNKGFSVYKSVGDLLDENISMLIKNELITFDMEAAMANASVCGGACEECSTDCEEDKKLVGWNSASDRFFYGLTRNRMVAAMANAAVCGVPLKSASDRFFYGLTRNRMEAAMANAAYCGLPVKHVTPIVKKIKSWLID